MYDLCTEACENDGACLAYRGGRNGMVLGLTTLAKTVCGARLATATKGVGRCLRAWSQEALEQSDTQQGLGDKAYG